ncbi:hypothetical protein M9Y10_001186 [Tritrichomonas musculus]|uniref:Ras-GAP domain-containing protein n=1 Tax=Tritrichomonas musculus TaxID=1915356 RepID=A0ABR2L6E9_9EUKA
MNSYILSNIILDQITRVDTIITEHPVSENEAIATKKVTPEHFLLLYCKKELKLLKKITGTQIQFSLSKFLNKTSNILNNINPKEPKFGEINRLCIFYVIAAECVLSYQGQEDVTNGYGASDFLIKQSSNVLSTNEYGKYNRYIQHNFTIFLSAVAAHSPSLYKSAFSKLIQEFTSGKIQQNTIRFCMFMPSKVSLLTNFINEAAGLTKIPSKFYDIFAQMITDTAILAFKRDIVAFISFLKEKTCIQSSEEIRKQIESWSKGNQGVWPSIVALQILMPKQMETLRTLNPENNKVLFKLTKFQKYRGTKKEMAIKAILTGFRAYALSNANQLIENLMSNYYQPFFTYFLQNHNELAHNSELAKYAFVDFPMCVLFRNPSDFEKQLLPIFEKPDRWTYLAKIIYRVCKQFGVSESKSQINNQHLDWQNSVLKVLLNPTVNIFTSSVTQQRATSCLPKLINSFTYYPNFLRKIAMNDIANFVKILQSIESNEDLSPQNAFISFFDPKYADQADIDTHLIMIYEVVLKFLVRIFSRVGLYRSTFLSDSVPEILLLMTENLFSLFLSNTNITLKDTKNILQHTKPVVSSLETGAILCLASSKEDFRTKGAQIISMLVELYHTLLNIGEKLDIFDNFLFPIEEYRGIDPHKKLRLASSIIKDALRSIGIANQAQKNAFQSLFQSFLALTKEVDPTIQLIDDSDEPLIKVEKPESILNDEWIGTFSVMLSILPDDDFKKVMRQLKILLSSQRDLGAIAVSAVPTAVAPRYFFAITNMCLEWIASAEAPQGYVDASSRISTLIMNVMRMVRGLAEQKNWPIVEPGIFNHLLVVMVAHCDMIPGEDFRLSCTKTIISIMKLLLSQNLNLDFQTRHTISKSLLGWLPTIANLSKEYNSTIHQCLALILDDLSLIECIDNNDPRSPEEKVDALFMLYFASIKSRLDMKETTETDMVPVLASLLKRNMSVGIEHCLSMGFDSKDTVRAAFIGAVSAVFHIPEVKNPEPNNLNTNKSLIDIVLNGNWDFIEIICRSVPYSRADAFGIAILEASLLRGIGFDFIDRMIFTEVDNVEIESKNTLFRGNAVPARAVGSLPRLIGTKWMQDTLKPIVLELLDNCKNGLHYIVDPSKIPADQNIEDNRKNFRDLLNKCLIKITGNFDKMPKGLIREAQMIFTSVERKYGDFAYQILASFLFLRFLLPAFTVPKLIGLDCMLPDEPRQALVAASTVLNVVTRSKQLNDKGEHLIPFNDFAADANFQFSEFFKRIVNTKLDADTMKDSDEILKELNLDEKDVIRALHSELYPLLNQIRKIANEHEDGNGNPNQNSTTNITAAHNPTTVVSTQGAIPIPVQTTEPATRNEATTTNSNNNTTAESLSIGKSAQRLADFLQSMGPPSKKNATSDRQSVRRRMSTFFISSKKEKININKQFNELMSTQIPEDIQLLLRGFIKKVENPATDETTILIVNVEKLTQIKDTKFGPYFFFKALQDIKTTQATIILILKGFNEESVPTSTEFEVLFKMPPIKLIKRVICLETSFSYVQFVVQNPTVLDFAPHVFPNSINNLASLIGPQLNSILPESSLESISKPESVHKALLVQSPTEVHEGQVKLFPNSVQITATPEMILITSRPTSQLIPKNDLTNDHNDPSSFPASNSSYGTANDSILNRGENHSRYYTIIPMTLMMFSDLKFDKPIRQGNELEFSLYAAKNEIRLRISDKSTLYETIVNIVRRNQIMKTLSSKVKVDTSTLQWLMLNLAFVNIVNTAVVPNVLKASIGLIYVIFISFEIKHNIEIINPNERLPSSMVGYVVRLSEDIAKNNPESFSGFLSEYFKVFSYVPKDSIPSTLLYLKPWIKLYTKDINNQPKITENFLVAFNDCVNASETFCEYVWSVIMSEDNSMNSHPIDFILHYTFEHHKEILPKISVSFARLNSKKMTTFLVKTLLNEWSEKKERDNNDIKFIWNSISLLFMLDLFDESLMCDFVYHMLTIRFKLDPKILLDCKGCFTNSISRVSFQNKNEWESEFNEYEIFYSFRNPLTPNVRGFYENCINTAKIYQRCTNSFKDKGEAMSSNFFQSFKNDFYDNSSQEDQFKKASSIIYLSAFSNYKNSNEFLNLMMKIMNDNADDDTVLIAVTTSLSFIYENRNNTPINNSFDTRLFFISIALCLRLRVSLCADLACKALSRLIMINDDSNQDANNNKSDKIEKIIDNITKSLNIETLAKLESLTGAIPLPFTSNPIFSAFVTIISSISDNYQFNSDSTQAKPSYSKSILRNNLESDSNILQTFIYSIKKILKKDENELNADYIKIESNAAIATVLLALTDSENQEILHMALKFFRKRRNDYLNLIQSANPLIQSKLQKRSNEFLWATVKKHSQNQSNDDIYANIPTWIQHHFCGNSDQKDDNTPKPEKITSEQFLNVINKC